MLYNSGSMWPSVVVHEHWPVSQRMIVEMGTTRGASTLSNIDELRTAILQEWQQFPQERTRRLVRSMTRRVTELHNKRVDILVIDFYALLLKQSNRYHHLSYTS
jgi:hypothetical protein